MKDIIKDKIRIVLIVIIYIIVLLGVVYEYSEYYKRELIDKYKSEHIVLIKDNFERMISEQERVDYLLSEIVNNRLEGVKDLITRYENTYNKTIKEEIKRGILLGISEDIIKKMIYLKISEIRIIRERNEYKIRIEDNKFSLEISKNIKKMRFNNFRLNKNKNKVMIGWDRDEEDIYLSSYYKYDNYYISISTRLEDIISEYNIKNESKISEEDIMDINKRYQINDFFSNKKISNLNIGIDIEYISNIEEVIRKQNTFILIIGLIGGYIVIRRVNNREREKDE